MKTEPNHLITSFNHIENCEGNFNGLTKREHFAVMAMQGYLAGSPDAANENSSLIATAEWSVKIADALINALNK